MTSPRTSTTKHIKSLWTLRGLSFSQLCRNILDRVNENDVFGRAAELAFNFLFALFPLILVMMTLFGLFSSHSIELQNRFLSYFADFLPQTAFQLLLSNLLLMALFMVLVGSRFVGWLENRTSFASDGCSRLAGHLVADRYSFR